MSSTQLAHLSSQDILDSLNDGVYVTDCDRRIVFWNKAAERIVGWRAAEIVGRSCGDNLLCHIDKDGHELCGEVYCPLHRAMVTDRGSAVPIIVFAQHKDGRRIPLQVSVAPIRDKSGEVIGGVETFRDLSSLIKDLKRAKSIQEQSLRMPQESDPRITFISHYIPYDVVGGDYFSIERLDEDCYVFLLADVMGHGIAAALYTMYLHSLWEESRSLLASPATFFTEVNRKLCALGSEGDTFATGVFGVVDIGRQLVHLCNAAGPPLVVVRGNSTLESLSVPGFPLGLMAGMDYVEETLSLAPGDSLLCFSDGAIEVRDAQRRELGVDGLLALLKETGYPDTAIKMAELERRLLLYSNAIRLDDDLTFLGIHLVA
ncbi:MAG: SpoIIE family protein phosphatase [Deltaproteobacteria bacterium]|nr:SpoIIE family protein phosphatase [Candidatus Anaeroferrophillus wilburensis]MBN2887779.1 SpoIIE family protein phosphatase [Deltaproteobacteria bacterium]